MSITNIPTQPLLDRLRAREARPSGDPFTHPFFRKVMHDGNFAFAGSHYTSPEPPGAVVDVLKSLDITFDEARSLFLSSSRRCNA